MEVGDTVMPVFLADCRDCVDCRSERSNMCSRLPFRAQTSGMPRDGTTRFTDAAGDPVHHFLAVSSFSQYTVVDVANVVKVSSELPPEKICVLSCGFSTGELKQTPYFLKMPLKVSLMSKSFQTYRSFFILKKKTMQDLEQLGRLQMWTPEPPWQSLDSELLDWL